ncbi:hypothetical protein FRC16_001949 [Serendipita sp. 398]|nr:hypothetical protein FRC16_001949 [Serendipita sp. 398]
MGVCLSFSFTHDAILTSEAPHDSVSTANLFEGRSPMVKGIVPTERNCAACSFGVHSSIIILTIIFVVSSAVNLPVYHPWPSLIPCALHSFAFSDDEHRALHFIFRIIAIKLRSHDFLAIL